MNGTFFKTWVNDQPIPNQPQNSIVVIDNTSYHNMQVEGPKAPTNISKKGKIVDWLASVGVKKTKIDIIKLYKLFT